MSVRQGTYSLWKNPAVTERQHRTLWVMTQVLALGLMLGLMSRVAWDLGIVDSFSLAIRNFSVAMWVMLQDLAAACTDFFQVIIG
jgi:hypothetical protein